MLRSEGATLLCLRPSRWGFTFLVTTLVVLSGMNGPAYALMPYGAEFACPIGGGKFFAQLVGTYTQTGMRLDLRPLGPLIAPMPLPVCPDNGFVMYRETFSEAEIDRLKPLVLSDDYRRLRAEHTDYYMVAYLRDKMGADRLTLAYLYLQASWEAEEQRSALLANYRSLALDNFEAFLKLDNSRSEQWWTAAVLVAELDRLLGRFDAAQAQLEQLPVNEARVGSAWPRVIDQIRRHSLSNNSTAQRFER